MWCGGPELHHYWFCRISGAPLNTTMLPLSQQAPLFNREHLLSKPIPQLIGSSFNLCIQFAQALLRCGV